MPAGKRKAALALQLPQWSPFADSNYAIVWQQGFASVWCWDNGRINAEILKHSKSPKSHKKIPESVLRLPLQSGLRMLKCLDGVEGQQWQEGQLVASRWWPERPDEHAWIAFQRDCGIPADQQDEKSTLQDLPLQIKPWGKISTLSGSTDELPIIEVALYGVLLLALGLPTLFLGIHHHQIGQAINDRAEALAAIKQQASPLFTAREAALNALDRLKAIYSIERYPQPLVLMAAVAEALPKGGGAFVREWEMTDNHLKITVNSPNSNIVGSIYVQALEKAGAFNEIQIITNADPKLMTFSMSIRPLAQLGRNSDVTDKRTAL